MNSFIPTIRTDRIREIFEYEARGYSFRDKRTYLFIRSIDIPYAGDTYSFQVRVDVREVKFHSIKGDGSIYLTVGELAHLFFKMRQYTNTNYIVTILKSILESDSIHQFMYQRVDYALSFSNDIPISGDIEVGSTQVFLSYIELFLLLSLIQSKSNYFFSISKDSRDKSYSNGLIRLLIVLLSIDNDDPLLMNLGWYYDPSSQLFRLASTGKHPKTDRRSKKYYLTENEMRSILGVES